MRTADNIAMKSILKKTFLASAMKSFSMIGTYFRAKKNFLVAIVCERAG